MRTLYWGSAAQRSPLCSVCATLVSFSNPHPTPPQTVQLRAERSSSNWVDSLSFPICNRNIVNGFLSLGFPLTQVL